MSIFDDLRRLRDLHDSGGLTDAEYSAAKAAVLAGNDSPVVAPAQLQQEAALARLDHAWEKEQEEYLSKRKGTGAFTRALMTSVGIMWATIGFQMFGGLPGNRGGFLWLLPWLGVLLAVVMTGITTYNFSKVRRYARAYHRYCARREAILNGQLDQADPPPPE
ncbi:MAG TPA: SHOCT domain-containing protein [Gemmataceae bacterium]|nr:SHOCT domain-containing protein [Gemmataceae bacterium]